jgi:hypothetical protein
MSSADRRSWWPACCSSWSSAGPGRTEGVAQQLSAGAVLAVVVGLGLTAWRRRNAVRSTPVVMGACAGMCFAVDPVFLKGVASAAGEPTYEWW